VDLAAGGEELGLGGDLQVEEDALLLELLGSGAGLVEGLLGGGRGVEAERFGGPGPGDAETARAGLLKALGLDTTTAPEKALDEAGSRAKKLQEKGVLLHLEIAPEPKL